eukprot:GAHX01000269.1.p1 GENE.GAHX01000269.1~~GAHX01000269.1.p1  ORF type:complete len:91 (-),score=14.99 GAHX01000269.1:16-288(-)
MTIENLNKELDDVKGTVSQNLNTMIKRRDQLQAISETSTNISKKADEFRIRAGKVRADMEAKRERQKWIIIGIIIAIILIIALIFIFRRK